MLAIWANQLLLDFGVQEISDETEECICCMCQPVRGHTDTGRVAPYPSQLGVGKAHEIAAVTAAPPCTGFSRLTWQAVSPGTVCHRRCAAVACQAH